MRRKYFRLAEKVKKHRFEVRHLTVFLVVLIAFQLIASFVHKSSLQGVMVKAQEWYQQVSAERLATLTATSLELLLETQSKEKGLTEEEIRKTIQDFNILFSQEILQQNVQEVCILVPRDTSVYAIDNGRALFSYAFKHVVDAQVSQSPHAETIGLYKKLRDNIRRTEQTYTVLEGKQTFHVFVPFVPRGEYIGALSMKSTPDFSFFTSDLISSYDEIALAYSALILFGLLAMYYISSYTLKERNEAQQGLFEEQKKHLAEQIAHEKEALFTKRIYHTHHKAEKVMGFIKEDLRMLTARNIDEIQYRINKYSNFIARVIYDMKWYDPPVQTIRGPLFHTDINDVIRFIVENIFRRVSGNSDAVKFQLELDERVPQVRVNEFVVWETLEPIIQNCLDHAGVRNVLVTIKTELEHSGLSSRIIIRDNGKGIEPDLLEMDEQGRRKLFRENATSGKSPSEHSGYGCYLAYEIAKERCGWELDAENLPDGGSQFVFTILHNS
jgi:signal transduction histidine kinase